MAPPALSLSELVAKEVAPKGPPCSVGTARDVLGTELAAELDALLADLSLPATAIARALAQLGHNIRADAMQRHRRGDCACG